MRDSHEIPIRTSSLRPAISEVNQSDREIRRLRILLLVLMFAEVISVYVPRIFNQWRGEFRFLPQVLIGFVVLALIFSLHHQLKWVNRSGKSATLSLFEVLPNEQKAAAEEVVIEAAFILRSNFRGSDFVVRYSTDQFLVVLPDTNEQQAQIALSRLIDKVDHWNIANEKSRLALRLALSTCEPADNLWEKLREIEERMRNKSDPEVRTLIPLESAGNEANELLPQEHLVQ